MGSGFDFRDEIKSFLHHDNGIVKTIDYEKEWGKASFDEYKQPSSLWFNEDGVLVSASWKDGHLLHSYDNRPSTITWSASGLQDELEYRTWGGIGRGEEYSCYPSFLLFNTDGRLIAVSWPGGEREKEFDYPGVIDYHTDSYSIDTLAWQDFFRHDDGYIILEHRESDKPAVQSFDKTGNIISEQYYKRGDLSRLSGPALVEKNEPARYFLYGDELSYEGWITHTDVANWMRRNKTKLITSVAL